MIIELLNVVDQVKNLLLRGNDPDSTGQSASLSVYQSVSQSVSQSASQSVSQSICEHCHLMIIELLNIVEFIFIFIFIFIF